MRFLSASCARSAIMAANGECSPALIRFLYSEKYSLLRSASCAGEMCRLILNHFDFFADAFLGLTVSTFFFFFAFSDATKSSNALKSASRGTFIAAEMAATCSLIAAI